MIGEVRMDAIVKVFKERRIKDGGQLKKLFDMCGDDQLDNVRWENIFIKEMVPFLLDHGADPMSVDNFGWTALNKVPVILFKDHTEELGDGGIPPGKFSPKEQSYQHMRFPVLHQEQHVSALATSVTVLCL